MITCTTCGKEIDELDVFPKGNCLACHAAVWEKLPPVKPDFTKVFGKGRK